MEFEAGGTYLTRDGREARVFLVDGGFKTPLVGAVKIRDGWESIRWLADGKAYHYNSSWDLMPSPTKVWLNIYGCSVTGPYSTKQDADFKAKANASTRIACVEISYRHGDGL
jgi:hypothetical protein